MVGVGDENTMPLGVETDRSLDAEFPLGQLLATPGALEIIEQSRQTPRDFLSRHSRGDWGDVCHEDRRLNDQSVTTGSRILSAYTTNHGIRLWVITDAADEAGKRPSTTILLPQEY